MRVLFVSSGNKDGEVPPIIKSQGSSLIEKGIDLEFLTINGKGIKGYTKSIFEIRNKIKKNSYDLVHVHYGLSGIAVLLGLTMVPKILSLMGDDILGPKRRNGTLSFKGKILTLIIRFSLKYFDAIIVKSEEMASRIIKYNPLIIPNGVSFKNFKQLNKEKSKLHLNIKTDKKVILFPANKNRVEKNYSLFSRALQKLSDREIEEIYFNNVPHDQTKFYFNSSDVVVLTSMHEGSPNVIKEAMACNIPIVSTAVGDVKEVIGNTEGCFIARFEPEDVANKIKKAIDYGKRTTGREDIIYLESGYIADRIIELYNQTTKI